MKSATCTIKTWLGEILAKCVRSILRRKKKDKLYRKLDARAQEREEEDKQLERDDFSYDYER